MAFLPIVSVSIAWNVFGGSLFSSAAWWATAVSGVVLSVGLFFLGRGRKRSSRLEVVDEAGVLRLYRGGRNDGAFGTQISLADVSHAGVSTEEYTGRKAVLLSAVGDRGLTVEALEIPQRLLVASPDLCGTLTEMASRDGVDPGGSVAAFLADVAVVRNGGRGQKGEPEAE